MPDMDGIAAIREIKGKGLEARILVLTSFSEENRVFQAIKAGALGYLLKDFFPASCCRQFTMFSAVKHRSIPASR